MGVPTGRGKGPGKARRPAALLERLAEAGEVLMPLDNYGFSTRFGWVNDQFGVSWQLNLT